MSYLDRETHKLRKWCSMCRIRNKTLYKTLYKTLCIQCLYETIGPDTFTYQPKGWKVKEYAKEEK
jgi:hypothetical protein